jgi:ABC-type branched-subunit amino acid transport system substrate-binding protein
VANGARLALAEAGGRAGGLRIEAVYLDDTGGGPRWSPVASAANARRAAEDSSTIGYIGELDSGATRFSLPITNQAGIAHISPGATAVDLTRFVTDELDPDRYRPSEEQTFLRLVPDEEDALRAVRKAAGRIACRTNDGSAEVASPFREPFRLPPQAAGFLRDYRKRFGRPLPPAAYGYEAMALLLDSIHRAGDRGDERDEVIENLIETSDRRSVIGDYSIDANGDTTLEVVTVYAADGCRLRRGLELDVSS